ALIANSEWPCSKPTFGRSMQYDAVIGESQLRRPKFLTWTMAQRQPVKASERPTWAGRSREAPRLPLPQPLRLLCAAERVECIGSDAGAVLSPGMVSSKSLVVCGKRGFAEGERFRWLADEKK